MTPKGRGVVGVKADQRGCGASSQDKAHKSNPFSEEAIFFHFSIRIKIQSQSSHCARWQCAKVIIQSQQTEREVGLGDSGVLGGGVNKVVYFRLDENYCPELWETIVQIHLLKL